MKASLDYIKKKFAEYNAQMFEGKLQPLPFKLSSARTFLGQVRCKRTKNADGTWHYSDFVFVISDKMDLDECEIEDTVIHEMIHYYILSNQIQDTAPHGVVFQKIMREINVRFNRNVSLSHQFTAEEHDKDKELRQHLICVVRLRGNRMGITVSTRSKLFYLWDEIPKFEKVEEWHWYSSTDPFFNRYPRASTVKIYSITREDLEEHLKGAKELVRHGNLIRVINKVEK